MTQVEKEQIAKEVYNLIKTNVSNEKETNISIWVSGNKTYSIRINGTMLPYKFDDKVDLVSISDNITRMLNKDKEKNPMLFYESNIFDTSGNWYCRSEYAFLSRIYTLAKPCKDFLELVKYVNKFGGIKICPTDLYVVTIGGKRGKIYGEEGDRYYLCHDEKKCKKILSDLRATRKTNDVVKCSNIKTKDDIDEWELECSIRNEVEFSGSRETYIEFSVQTQKGKLKDIIII